MKKILTGLLFASAIAISASAEFFSIYGLSKVFYGEAVYVIILASCLGLSKLTMVGFLHEYWGKFNTGFWMATKYLFIVFVGVLILITSAGVYGFLSSAYQVTADKDKINTAKINLLEKKRDRFALQLEDLKKERDIIVNNIQGLSKSLSTDNQYQTIDRKTGQILTQIQKTSKKGVEAQLLAENNRRDQVVSKIDNVTDSIQSYDVLIILANQNNDAGSELGTLRYISNLTAIPMDRIVNIFILLLTLVIDPLAIFLLIAALFTKKSGIEVIQEKPKEPEPEAESVPEAENTQEPTPAEPVEEVETDNFVEETPPAIKLKRKRGRPRKAQRVIQKSIIPELIDEPNTEKSEIARTVLENDLSSEVMRHLTDSLGRNRLTPTQRRIMPHQEVHKWEKNK